MTAPTDIAELERAIANCDRDPIHIPGAIQGFGHLVATDARFRQIAFVSVNADAVFDRPAVELLGQEVEAVFSPDEIHSIRNAISHDTIETQRELVGARMAGAAELQLTVHCKGGRAILEMIPEQQPAAARFKAVEQARRFLAHPGGLEDVDELLARAVIRLRSITGYDRVKAYRFLPDGSGEVVAEAKGAATASFLGLRFPASDIPPIARKLYAQTPIRLIADVQGDNMPVLATSANAEPLDLSLATLRGTDKVHIQYLKNMGVGATLTVPIVVDGVLWGLFAAHHMTPKRPDPSMLMAAELSGRLISLRIQHALEMRRQEQLRSTAGLASKLVALDESLMSLPSHWAAERGQITDLVPSDGFVVRLDDQVDVHGADLSPTAAATVFALANPDANGLTAIDDLPKRLPGVDWGEIAGAMILSLSNSAQVDLALLRKRADRETVWAGAPEKEITRGPDGPKLTPRNSFALYKEKVKDKAREWTAQDMEMAAALNQSLASVLDTHQDMRGNRQRLGLLVRELNHRVRNILSLVQSLSAQSRDAATSVEGYANALEQRIIALAGAHNLLTRSEMHGAHLRDLITLELRPFNRGSGDGGSGDGGSGRATLDGPDLCLNAEAAPVVALILHELTSNAVKYGALSAEGGHVHVSWRLKDDGVALDWRESGGPEVVTPNRVGFGASIIENAAPYELAGRAKLQFEPGGVAASFWLPGEHLTDLSAPAVAASLPALKPAVEQRMHPEASSAAPRRKRRALVVEDNFVIAMQAKRILRDEDFIDIDAAPTIAEALALLHNGSYDFCLLDMNLHGDMSTPIAHELRRKNIPFFLATGYGSVGNEIASTFGVTVISKPVDQNLLVNSLRELFPPEGEMDGGLARGSDDQGP